VGGVALKLENIQTLVKASVEQTPQKNTLPDILKQPQLLIEIPAHINELQNKSPKLPFEWREATRLAFTDAIAAGYIVEELYRLSSTNQSVGSYLLGHRKKGEDLE
jgi:predicted GNAT superfamily acetyltransferase